MSFEGPGDRRTEARGCPPGAAGGRGDPASRAARGGSAPPFAGFVYAADWRGSFGTGAAKRYRYHTCRNACRLGSDSAEERLTESSMTPRLGGKEDRGHRSKPRSFVPHTPRAALVFWPRGRCRPPAACSLQEGGAGRCLAHAASRGAILAFRHPLPKECLHCLLLTCLRRCCRFLLGVRPIDTGAGRRVDPLPEFIHRVAHVVLLGAAIAGREGRCPDVLWRRFAGGGAR